MGSARRSAELIQRQIIGAKQGDAVKHEPTGDLYTVDAAPKQGDVDGTYTLVSAVDPTKRVDVFAEVRTYSLLDMEWPSDLLMDTPLETLPDPTRVLGGFDALAIDLGVTMKVNSLKVLEIVRSPAHQQQVGKDVVAFQSIKDSVAKLGGSEIDLTGGAPDATEAVDDDYYAGFARFYAVAAQNTGVGGEDETLSLNVNMSKYVDMIHEFAHGYEVGNPPFHLREGLAEMFAAMAAAKIGITYVYNPSYSTFVAAVHQLRELVGLRTLASYYFEQAGALRQRLQGLGLDAKYLSVIFANEGKIPDDWGAAMSALAGKVGGVTPAALPGEDAARTGFTDWLESEAAAQNVDIDGLSAMDSAEKVRAQSERRTIERRLWLLHRHRLAVGTSNPAWADAMNALIEGHAAAWKGLTGEDAAATRKRLLALAEPPG